MKRISVLWRGARFASALVCVMLLSACAGFPLVSPQSAQENAAGEAVTTKTKPTKAEATDAADMVASTDAENAEDAAAENNGLKPDPSLSPDAVVRIQMEAMQNNDMPEDDAGIRTAFVFASPQNKEATGPVERFITMIKDSEYSPMIDARSIEYGPTRIDGNIAVVSVILLSADGDVVGYIFGLSKQTDGLYEDCWMTDMVMRVDVPDDHNPFGDEI